MDTVKEPTNAEIFRRIEKTDEKLDKLSESVAALVAVNHRLDEHKSQLKDHEVRIRDNESDVLELKSVQKPHTPWYQIVGGIVGILTGVSLLGVMFQILNAIGG